MAIAWTLRDPRVTSALIGASSVEQLEQNVAALDSARLLRRGAGRDRPLRGGVRHQPLGASRATPDARAMPHLHRITTRWDDNDVYGHVNNVRYFAFFDTAINAWLVHEGGLDIQGGDVIGLCAESHCAYHARRSPSPAPSRSSCGPAGSGRRASATSSRCSRPTRRTRAAEGWFVHVFVDRATRRPVPLPARLRGALERLAAVSGDRLHLEATPVKYGAGAVDDAGWELARLGVRRALLVTDPGVAATGHPERVRASLAAAGIEVVIFDRARVEPTLESLRGGGRVRHRRARRRLRLGRRRLVDRHGEGRRPRRLPPGARHGLRQRARRRGAAAARAAASAPRDPDDDRDRLGGDDGGRARRPRRCAVKTGISHRYLRPSQAIVDPDLRGTAPAEVDRLGRPRRRLPRRRVAPRAPVHVARAAGDARRPPALPGRQPGRRRLVGQGAGARRPLPAPRRRGAATSRRAAR